MTMAVTGANRWALENYRALVYETIMAVREEVGSWVTGGRGRVLTSLNDAYALAARFKGVIYRYPYFQRKHVRIIHALIDRCGEDYRNRQQKRIYISDEVLNEWSEAFGIPHNRLSEYLWPLLALGILVPSDRPDYRFKVSDEFFRLVGPVAANLVATSPTSPQNFSEVTAIVNGIASIYVMSSPLRIIGQTKKEVRVMPWSFKLAMIYTLSGLQQGSNLNRVVISDALESSRVNTVDNYFVVEKSKPVELWRSIRTEAFEILTDNKIIEGTTATGYKLNSLWVRMHEEGVRRYLWRQRQRYISRYGLP